MEGCDVKKQLICLLTSAFLLTSVALAAGIGAFDSAGCNVYTGSSYYAEFDSNYDIDAYGSDPPLFCDGLAPVCLNGLWGYVDRNGFVAIDLTYSSAGSFSEGRAFVGTPDGISCIDTEGNLLFTLPCQQVFPYSNGLAKFRQDDLYGFVDLSGNIVVEPVWLDAGYAAEGFISVADENGYGYIDYSGSVFITPQYEVAAEFSGGAAYVQNGQTGMLINMEGDVIYENVYSGLIDGLAVTQAETGWGFVDALGKIAVDCVWEDVDLPSEGLIGVRSGGKWGFINLDGETVIDFVWDFVWPFSDGMAMVAVSSDGYAVDQYGFINSVGEQVVACEYDSAKSFSGGRAAVCRDGLWGYIDALGSEIVPCAYEFASDFHDNHAVTGSNGVFTVIDAQGNPITFYREEEAPLPPPPEEEPQPEEEEPLILPEKETPSGQKTSVGTIIAIVLAGLFLLFLATAILLREVNIRRRRRRRLISRGRGKHGK